MATPLTSQLSGAKAGLALLLGLLTCPAALGQAGPFDDITRQLGQHEQRMPQEKLYLHLDRPAYLSGETMWFKIYAVDGTHSRPLALSSVAYVEVLDATNRPVLQGKVALKKATGQGSFVLPGALAAGSYTVRAYTNWMKNFGPEAYFHSTVTVINTTAASGAARKDTAAYDAQFFPEGGNLVSGLRSKVAFKITNAAGKGVAAEGQVLNKNGAVVATFATFRLGMGNFAFTPLEAQSPYTAVVKLPGTRVVTWALPRAFEQGYVLRLEEAGPDQLALTITSASRTPETIFLLAHSRQQLAASTALQLIDGKATLLVNKAQLLAGVSHFTVFNSSQKPVCERLYFQAPQQHLNITARANKAQYASREKVSVELATTGQKAPVAANLSMAVYRLDSLATAGVASIEQSLLLTADLKGLVEAPGYYFTATGPETAAAADNLMLTQGWSRFRWEEVLAPTPQPLAYLPEPNGPVVRGQLTQAGTATPRPGVMTYLSSPSRVIRLSNALSAPDGRFQFEMNGFTGSREIIVQTDPRQDSTAQLTLLDPFSSRYAAAPVPTFGLATRFTEDYGRRHLEAQLQNTFAGKYRNLFAPALVDSMAFYGKPNETYFLDKYTRFKVVEEILREYVPGVVVRIRKDGFHLRVADVLNKALFEDNPMVLVDGMPVFNMNRAMAMNPLKVQKLEVIDSRYFHGPAVYNGLLSFTTYKGDLEGFPIDAHALVRQYEGVQRQREFYAPRYDTPQARQSRLPDLRNLLYWNPEITTNGAKPHTLDFYTGDQTGRYLVVLQGLSATGLAGTSSFVLEVTGAL